MEKGSKSRTGLTLTYAVKMWGWRAVTGEIAYRRHKPTVFVADSHVI